MPRPRPSTLIAALLVALCLVPLSAAAAPGQPPAWGTEPSPNAGFPRNAFAAVDALSSSDAWAVGSYEAAGFNHPRPIVQRWNGSQWSQVEVGWPEEGELLGVDAVTPNDVWMVGGYQSGGQALIAHWDGTALEVVPHPNPGEFNRLYDVTAVSADDVWAVGEFTSPISQTLVLHWDGSTWTHVPSPTGEGYNQLNGVTALAADDVWAVGEDGTTTLALHWDGSAWTRVPTPSPGFSATLRAVSASPDGAVWAVGDSGTQSLTLRWAGSQWEQVESPSPGVGFLDLNGVVSISANDAWAVGAYDVSGNWRTLTLHWDGTAWSQVGSPSPDPVLNLLNAVAAAGAEVLAVGHGGGTGSLALERTAEGWARLMTQNAGTGENVLNGISAASAGDIWAVGHAQQRSLTLHYDGAAWSVVPSPNREFGIRLEDVVALSASDVWAVGWSGSAGSLDDQSAAMHWDGQAWSLVPTPQPGGTAVDRLLAVDAVAPNDVWAVGLWTTPQLDHRSVILHWDGKRWSTRPHDCDTYWGLTGITVVSPTDVWAVGNATTCHFDGTFWNEVPSPQPRPEHYEIAYPLEDVSAAAANDAWAVGARVLEGPFGEITWRSLAEHWDGTAWTAVYTVPGQVLYGVEALSSNDVYAVGGNGFGPLIVHYDGASWSTIPTPEAGRGGRLAGIEVTRNAGGPMLSPILGDAQLWAAGSFNPGYRGHRTLIQTAPSSREGAVVGDTNVGFATVSWFGPESGSTTTTPSGEYQVGGLQAGTYTFTATEPGCTPDARSVTVVAGQTLDEDFHIDCDRPRPAGDATGSLPAASLRVWRSASSRRGS